LNQQLLRQGALAYGFWILNEPFVGLLPPILLPFLTLPLPFIDLQSLQFGLQTINYKAPIMQ
jgi:hypothetical protein